MDFFIPKDMPINLRLTIKLTKTNTESTIKILKGSNTKTLKSSKFKHNLWIFLSHSVSSGIQIIHLTTIKVNLSATLTIYYHTYGHIHLIENFLYKVKFLCI
jgi:hypothetical protein